MPITYIDTHAHLFSDQFDIDLDEVVNRSLAADVTKVLLPNIDLDSVGRMFSICDQYPEFFAPMVGLHPCSVTDNYKVVLEELLPYLFDPRVVAVGEMGTDLYWDQSLIAEQIEAFKIQCQWAKESNLPIVIHCRDSMDLTIELVRGLQNGHLRGVFHCFGGTLILLPSAIPIFLWRTVVPYRCPLLPVQSLHHCWSCSNHDMCCTRLLSSRIQWEGVGFHGPNRLPTAEELFSPDEIFVIGGPCFPALWLIVVFWAKSSLV